MKEYSFKSYLKYEAAINRWLYSKSLYIHHRSLFGAAWAVTDCIYGPFFFEDAQSGNDCIVTTETYLGMLETVLDVEITPDIWFQQDGAPAHTSVIARDWLKSRFGNKVISHLTETSHGLLGPLTIHL